MPNDKPQTTPKPAPTDEVNMTDTPSTIKIGSKTSDERLAEIDKMLTDAWDNFKVSPRHMSINAELCRTIFEKQGFVYTDEEWLQWLAENADENGVVHLGFDPC